MNNTKKMGIVVAAFFGFILLSSTILIGIPGVLPPGSQPQDPGQLTITGTPMDNYMDSMRPQFCGQSMAKSTAYITEYSLPRPCTQPMALTVAPDGGVWVGGTNTGDLARFEPLTQTFTEYENPQWPEGEQTQMWGMDYADGSIWYTDAGNQAVWRYDIGGGTYTQTPLSIHGVALPQTLEVVGGDIVINDLIGNSMVIIDQGMQVFATPPADIDNAMTSGFDTDAGGSLWYINWIDGSGGLLAQVHPDLIKRIDPVPPEVVELPLGISAPNGVAVDHEGNVWITDTNSSYFYKYDILTGNFTQYVTSNPNPLTYGNYTGIIKSPITRPYWMEVNDMGNVVFNEQTGNRMAVMHTGMEKLVEYDIPSRNPYWTDCSQVPVCGISQALTFTLDGTDVWFSEWAENNIGHLDTARPLPFDISIMGDQATLRPGETAVVFYDIVSTSDRPVTVAPTTAYTHTFLVSSLERPGSIQLLDNSGDAWTGLVSITALADAPPGSYKVLVGGEGSGVSVSRYVTVNILP